MGRCIAATRWTDCSRHHGWYGKAFHGPEQVDPLLFHAARGPIAIDPKWLPLSILHLGMMRSGPARLASRVLRPLLATRKPAARLRTMEWRGEMVAAMIYDRLPIVDLFKRAGPDLVLGLMDLRGQPPFFFTLERDD